MDLSSLIVSLANNITTSAWILLWSLGALVGFIWGGTAFTRLIRASRVPGQNSFTASDVFPILIVGALMMNLSTFINNISTSIGLGTVSYGPLSYDGASSFGHLAGAINAVLTLVSLAGGVFSFKGMLILKKAAADGQSSNGGEDHVWRAITHLVSGCILIQITHFIDAIQQSLHMAW